MHRHASYVLFCTQEKDRFIRAQVLYISMQYSSFKWPVLTATHFWVSARLSSLFDTDRAPACPTSTLRCADYKSRWWVQLLMAIRSFRCPLPSGSALLVHSTLSKMTISTRDSFWRANSMIPWHLTLDINLDSKPTFGGTDCTKFIGHIISHIPYIRRVTPLCQSNWCSLSQ